LNISAQKNEVNKRNLGLKHVKKNKCSHFLSIDCDEFYLMEQFESAKQVIERNSYDATACELVNYFHDSKFQMVEHTQYVPFIFKISWLKKHKYAYSFPVPVDPTRAMKSKKIYCFNKKDLLMHHMSYVREDYNSIKSKLENSPNKRLFLEHIDTYLAYYDNWDPKQPALNPHQFINRQNYLSPNIITLKKPIILSIRYTKRSLLLDNQN